MHTLLKAIGLLALLIYCQLATAQTLTMGIIPQFPKEQLQNNWRPLLDELEKQSHLKIDIKYYKNMTDFEQGLLKGELDIAYINPHHAVIAYQISGYHPILRDKETRLTSTLMVAQNAPITQVSQLNGTTIAFPTPNEFAASLYMRALLKKQENIDFKATYLNDENKAYEQVLTGKAQAASGVLKQAKELRVIYQTPETYGNPIVLHPRLSPREAKDIKHKLLEIAKQQPELFKKIAMPEPVPSSYNNYQPLAKMRLKEYLLTEE